MALDIKASIKIDIVQGDDTDDQVRQELLRDIGDYSVTLVPTGTPTGNGHTGWQLAGPLVEVLHVLLNFVGVGSANGRAVVDLCDALELTVS